MTVDTNHTHPTPKPTHELIRAIFPEVIESAVEILREANVPHLVSTNRPGLEFLTVGNQSTPHDIIITVAEDDVVRARSALEKAYGETPLPEGHFLETASQEDIAEILGNAHEWGPFEVAHARRIATERGIDTTLIKTAMADKIAALKLGRKPSVLLMIFCWCSAMTGGLLGLFAGISLATLKKQSKHGEFFVFDAATRKQGVAIAWVGLLVFIASWAVYLAESDFFE